MGTNYYWHEKSAPCHACGHDKARVLHIGKSNMGWVFMLHIDPEESLSYLEDWQERWKEPGSRILSEYGTQISIDQMNDIILDRENSCDRWSAQKMIENQAISGPNGLYRGLNNFPAPNDATYDLVDGEFS